MKWILYQEIIYFLQMISFFPSSLRRRILIKDKKILDIKPAWKIIYTLILVEKSRFHSDAFWQRCDDDSKTFRVTKSLAPDFRHQNKEIIRVESFGIAAKARLISYLNLTSLFLVVSALACCFRKNFLHLIWKYVLSVSNIRTSSVRFLSTARYSTIPPILPSLIWAPRPMK